MWHSGTIMSALSQDSRNGTKLDKAKRGRAPLHRAGWGPGDYNPPTVAIDIVCFELVKINFALKKQMRPINIKISQPRFRQAKVVSLQTLLYNLYLHPKLVCFRSLPGPGSCHLNSWSPVESPSV